MADHNPLIQIILAEDHQTDEIHKIIHKIDIADQLVKTTNSKIIIFDQTEVR